MSQQRLEASASLQQLIANKQLRDKTIELLNSERVDTAQGMMKFINSPRGKASIATLSREFAAFTSIQEEQRFEALELQRAEERFMAFLLLCLSYKDADAANTLNAFIQNQIDKLLKETAAKLKKTGSIDKEMEKKLADYYELLVRLNNKLIEILQLELTQEELLKKLEAEWQDIQKEGAKLDAQDAIYQEKFTELDAFYATLPAEPAEVAKSINEKIEELRIVIERSKAVNNENVELVKYYEENEQESAPSLELKPRDPMLEALVREMQIQDLNERLDIVHNRRAMYSEAGEQIHDHTLSPQAALVAPIGYKIEKRDGLFCLIEAALNMQNMEEAAVLAAHQKFNACRPMLTPFRTQCTMQQNAARRAHAERSQSHKNTIAAELARLDSIRSGRSFVQAEFLDHMAPDALQGLFGSYSSRVNPCSWFRPNNNGNACASDMLQINLTPTPFNTDLIY